MAGDSDRKQPKNPLGPTGDRVMANIKQLRLAQGLTYKELSERLEHLGRPIPVLGLSRLERGERRVDVDDLVALAVALETTPNRLLLPEMNFEHAAEHCQLTPAVRETPPLLWAWATGEVPLGHLPATAATDRTARSEEVTFSRLNRPQHWHDWNGAAPQTPPAAWTQELTLARTGLMAYLIEAFRAGFSTAEIRAVVEGTFAGVLLISDPAALSMKIEATGEGIGIHLDTGSGEVFELRPIDPEIAEGGP